MDEAGQFYQVSGRSAGSHLALRWKGRVRYIVPCSAAGQSACWKLFHPGRIELPLRAMAGLPRFFGVAGCVESDSLSVIRKAVGPEAGVSCCRLGAPGPWTKETILFLDQDGDPELIVKAGKGESVDWLLRNEAEWLSMLRAQPQLAGHVPEMVAHRAGTDLSFVAQSVVRGRPDFELGELHISFLKKFQEVSRSRVHFEESKLYQNIQARLKVLDGLLTAEWSQRIEKAVQRIEEQFSGGGILMNAAHNDFTPWNIRMEGGVARIFDWEHACQEQFPLFDPLHFVLMPMALNRQAPALMIEKMRHTLQSCESWLGLEACHHSKSQALAYLINLCTLYLWAESGRSAASPVLESYEGIIDYLCCR